MRACYPEAGEWPWACVDRDGDEACEYILEVDPWNVKSADGYACIEYDYSTGTVHYVQDLRDIVQRSGEDWVHGYPEVYYGFKPWSELYAADGTVTLPAEVSELSSLVIRVSYRVMHEEGLPVNFAIESWLTREEFRRGRVYEGDVEVMVWLYYSGMWPAGSRVGSITVPVLVGSREICATFDVWVAHMGWTYVALALDEPLSEGDVALPYGLILARALEYAGVGGVLYLEDVEVGTEYGAPGTTEARMEWWIYRFEISLQEKRPHGQEAVKPRFNQPRTRISLHLKCIYWV